MKPDPILEELWRVKDDLAREAGYDIARTFAELRAAEGRHSGPLIRTAEELQRYVAEQHRRDSPAALALQEKFPPTPPKRKE
ncbi:MAG: hypothetical protein FJ398_23005 [Verrucomicrobia bacterium]|nr:hypothetical protein [Verrucomicrobiota bacterium]